jgi:hypothetical protein
LSFSFCVFLLSFRTSELHQRHAPQANAGDKRRPPQATVRFIDVFDRWSITATFEGNARVPTLGWISTATPAGWSATRGELHCGLSDGPARLLCGLGGAPMPCGTVARPVRDAGCPAAPMRPCPNSASYAHRLLRGHSQMLAEVKQQLVL